QPALPSAAHLPADWVIAIGSSTGGVQALTRILPEFPADTPPIVIVQHMPEGFTAAFARRLDGLCPMQVREAADGDTLERGRILIAPGGLRHMQLVTAGGRPRVALVEGDPVSYSRPSVDVLFTALARVCPTRCSAAILTGMGSDGAAGLLAIRQAGGRTFAQDEASSQIYGMPARAWERGGAEDQVPLSQMVPRLLGSVRAGLAAGYPRQPALP
ncbi:MAG: CheB methylesterase domain-containing protein, partial [Roseicyclus sp.]|nr:CheB methylesterase domain-containing protein [Roseicyclus sp.]